MKKNGFGRLVRVRAIWEKQAKARAAEAANEVVSRIAEAASAAEAHSASLAETTSSMSPAHLALQRNRSMATHASLTEAAAARANAQARSTAAKGVWRRSAQDHDMAAELEQRRRQEAGYEARRASDRNLDELIATLRSRKPR